MQARRFFSHLDKHKQKAVGNFSTCKQARRFFCAHTHRKKLTGSLEFYMTSVSGSTC